MKRKIFISILLSPMIFLGRMYAPTPADASQLVLLTEPNPVIHFQERVPIQVKFVDNRGLPIPEARVVLLTRPENTADTILSNYDAFTDADGLAETFIEAGTEEVDFEVLIGVPSGDELPPIITVTVKVIPPDGGVPEANWPSEEFRSLQDAINAVADGGTLRISEGVYEVPQPLFIRNKMVNIVGEGAYCKDLLPEREQLNKRNKEKKSLGTVLVGPHVEGRVPPEESIGNLNFRNGGGSVKGIWSKGGKAGFVGRDIDGTAKPLDISDVCITDTVRGIHWKAAAPITVTDTIIADVEWNGISIAQSALVGIDNLIFDTKIMNSENFCIALIGNGIFSGPPTTIADGILLGCIGGGIAVLNTGILVEDMFVYNSRVAGIWLDHSAGELRNNIIGNTLPRISDGFFGDGITILLSPYVNVVDNHIINSSRAGLANFGSHVALGNTLFQCAGYELEGEDYQGVNFSFEDLGGNGCGCPNPAGACVAESAGIQPPEPAFPIE